MSENVPLGGHLTTPQRKALRALASGATKSQAATLAGRHERTISRWITEDSAFTDALKASTDRAVDDAGRRLAALLDLAVDVLIDIMRRDYEISPHVRLRAVDVAIGSLIKLREHGELTDRVAALEDRL
jgi:hypothetical protein